MQKFLTKNFIPTFLVGLLLIIVFIMVLSQMKLPDKTPTILTPFLSTFFGASFAFYLNSRKETRKEDDERISALRVALFTIAQQQNTLGGVWRTLREWNGRPDKVINLRPISLPDLTDLKQDLSALSFMIPVSPALLMELTLEDERFAQTVAAITRHAEFHVAEVQPALEKSSLNRKTVTLEDVEQAIGGRIFGTASAYAEQVFEHLVPARKSLEEVMPRLFDFAKSLYPDEKFLKIELEADPELPSRIIRPDYAPPYSSKIIKVSLILTKSFV